MPNITIDGKPVETALPVGDLPPSVDGMLPILEQSLNDTIQVVESFNQVTGAVINRQSQYLLHFKHSVETERALNREAQTKLNEENRRLNEEKEAIERQLTVSREREEALNDNLEALRENKEIADAENSKKLKRTYDNMKHLHQTCEQASKIVQEDLTDVNREVKARHGCLMEEMEDRVKCIAKVLGDPSKHEHHLLPAVSPDVPELDLKETDLGKPLPRNRSKSNKMPAKSQPADAKRVDDPERGTTPKASPRDPPKVPKARPPVYEGASGSGPNVDPNNLGLHLNNPEEVARIMVGVTEEEAQLVIKEVEEYINKPHCAVFAARRNSDFLKADHRLYDPNFIAEPERATHLTKSVRDIWRMWSGYWTDEDDQFVPFRRNFKIGEVEYSPESVERFGTFERIFGKQCYRLWPLAVLKGPCAWLKRLPQERKEEHMRWVDTVMKFNSLVPVNYSGLTELNQLPRELHDDRQVPDTQVYINGLPEMQDLELTNMINSFFGMLWPGNPFIISLSLLKQDTHNDPGPVSNGIAAVRFITVEMAQLFLNLFNGVKLYYRNYDTDDFKYYTTHQLKRNKTVPPVVWYYTWLTVSFTEVDKKRGFRQFELPHRELLARCEGRKPQHCLWQKDFACYDYPQWVTNDREINWLVDPCTGDAYSKELKTDRFALPLICAPDNSYWAAMGCYHPKVDLTVKQDSLGCWINQVERESAWNDETFFTEIQRQQRAPRLTAALPTHQDVRRQAGRAVSHAPNRRGYHR